MFSTLCEAIRIKQIKNKNKQTSPFTKLCVVMSWFMRNLRETYHSQNARSDVHAPTQKQTAALPESIFKHKVLQHYFAQVGDNFNPTQLYKNLKQSNLYHSGETITNHDLAVCQHITVRALRPEHRSGSSLKGKLRHMTSTGQAVES